MTQCVRHEDLIHIAGPDHPFITQIDRHRCATAGIDAIVSAVAAPVWIEVMPQSGARLNEDALSICTRSCASASGSTFALVDSNGTVSLDPCNGIGPQFRSKSLITRSPEQEVIATKA